MGDILLLILSLSLAGAILTGLAMGLNALLRRWAPRRFSYYLWLLVLLRFLCPVGGGEGVLGKVMAPPEQEWTVQAELAPPSVQSAHIDVDGATPAQEESWQVWIWLTGTVWLGGAVVALGVRGRGYVRLCRALRAQSVPPQPWEAELYARLSGGRRGTPVLLRSEAAVSPVLVGVFRPKIYLPGSGVPRSALNGILRHELTHWRRKDLLYKWIVWAVTGLHWFNPFVWLLSRAVEQDCELSCDEAVASSLNKTERLSYGRTLLWAAGREAGTAGMSAPLWSQKQCLKERLCAIMNPNANSKRAKCLLMGAALILVMASAALGAYTGQETADKEAEQSSEQTAFISGTLTAPESLAWPFQSDGEISLTQLFGTRVHPITGATTSHDGIDIRLDKGEAVLASADGVVIQSDFDPTDGQYVVLEHGGGLTTTYCHLSGDNQAQVGQQVTAGEQIGSVGCTGTSTGYHLHFEAALDETPIDPLDLLPYRGMTGSDEANTASLG